MHRILRGPRSNKLPSWRRNVLTHPPTRSVDSSNKTYTDHNSKYSRLTLYCNGERLRKTVTGTLDYGPLPRAPRLQGPAQARSMAPRKRSPLYDTAVFIIFISTARHACPAGHVLFALISFLFIFNDPWAKLSRHPPDRLSSNVRSRQS